MVDITDITTIGRESVTNGQTYHRADRSQGGQIKGWSDYRAERFQGRKIVRRKCACVDIADITTVGREAVTNRRTDHEGTDHRADKLQDENHF